MEELLAPDHAGERLAHDPMILRTSLGQELAEKDVRFALPGREDDLAAGERCRERMGGQHQVDTNVLTGRDTELVPGGEFSSLGLRIDRVVLAIDDKAMERVLDIGRRVGLPPQPLTVAFVFGEQQRGPLTSVQIVRAELGMVGLHQPCRTRGRLLRRQSRFCRVAPRTRYCETTRWAGDAARPSPVRDCGRRCEHGSPRGPPCCRHLDIEVPAIIENAAVEQTERRTVAVATGVLLDQPLIRIGGLRILVEAASSCAGSGIEIEVAFLDVLAAIALRARQPERALLEERITSVPQCQRQAQELFLVGNAAEAVSLQR